MKYPYQCLAAAPVLFAAASLVLWAVAPAEARPVVLAGAVGAAKVLALGGGVLAALAFDPGDYLRTAWLLLTACTLCLLGRDVVGLAGGAAAAQAALALAGNGASVAGTWMLARAWAVAGLAPEDAPAGHKGLLAAGAIALALVATGWPIVGDVRRLLGGDVFALVPLASDVADTVVLALLAPLLRIALAMRGGVLRWPWALLTAGVLVWLVFDAVYGVVALWHLDAARARVAMETLRVLGTVCTFSAGVSQRWAVRG